MEILIAVYLFIIGTMCGSFALVLADRIHAKKDWVKGRSACDSCGKTLQPIDLVPVLSWLTFRGRCRHCKKKLSPAYPLMELLTGTIFAVSFIYWPYELNSATVIIQFSIWLISLIIMAALFIYDARWYLLPFKLVNPLIALAAGFALLDLIASGVSFVEWMTQLLLAGAVTYGLFKVMYTASKGTWIGGGDVRLSIAIALFTGSLLSAWLSIFASSVIGLLIALPMLVKRGQKQRRKLKLPFGPALLAGLFVAVVFSDRVVEWYETLLVF